MSLQNIQLPASAIMGLYGNSWLLLDEKQSAAPINGKEKKPAQFLGENKQGVIIMVDYEEFVHIPDNHLAFLSSILTACKLNLSDVAIINIARQKGLNYQLLQKDYRSRVVLLAGQEPGLLDLPVSFPNFQVQQYDQVTYLTTPPLAEMEADKALKGKLWACLKGIFNV
jgi:hypothetical protein